MFSFQQNWRTRGWNRFFLVIGWGEDIPDNVSKHKNDKINILKRARIDKWNCIKLKNFCTQAVIRMKRQPTEWEKHL
jgi:hypothetical protein